MLAADAGELQHALTSPNSEPKAQNWSSESEPDSDLRVRRQISDIRHSGPCPPALLDTGPLSVYLQGVPSPAPKPASTNRIAKSAAAAMRAAIRLAGGNEVCF